MTTLLVSLILSFAPSTQSSATQVGAQAWQDDLKFLADELPKLHVNAFTRITRADWDKEVAALRDRIESLDDASRIVAFMQLVARIGDSHTVAMNSVRERAFHQYPLAFYFFSDGPIVALAPADQRELLGAKVVGIGSASFDEAAKRVATIFASENDSYLKQNLPRMMNTAEVLYAVGLSDRADRATFVLELPDKSTKRVELSPIPTNARPNLARLNQSAKTQAISSRVPAGRGGPPYSMYHSPPDKLVYVRYDACANDPKKPFADFANEVLKMIDDNDVEKFVFDVRTNGGGDSKIAQPLIDGIASRAKVNRKGGVFVIIGRGTFSSAQLNARDFQTKTKAILIGEPTGQKPNHFGEVKSFTLPNSKLVIQYSTKFFKSEDGDRPAMMPDILVEPASADFAAGRDVVLDRVLEYRGEGR